MNFLSVCSGIEAASVAFAPLGWQALAFAEIEPFPCEVLAHHYPHVPNLGDLTQWRTWPEALLRQVDILVGGTPCQAFSLAGLRESLDDARGNLTLTFCELYDHLTALRRAAGLPAPLCLWENVPGVLSTHDNAFGCFLAGLAGESLPLLPAGPAAKPGRPHKWADAGAVLGPARAVAWRTLDAQYFELAQRRRRVFALASADPAFDPLAVLFEWEGLRRDTPPSREPGQSLAHDVAPCLTSGGRGIERTGDPRGQDPVIAVAENSRAEIRLENGDGQICGALSTGGGKPGQGIPTIAFPERLSATQYASAADVSPVLQSSNPTAVAYAIQERAVCENPQAGPDVIGVSVENVAYTLEARQTPQAVAFQPRIARNGRGYMGEVVNALQAQSGGTGKVDAAPCVAIPDSPTSWRVRRLTCEECEILQGFPVGYTLIPSRKKKPKLRDPDDLVETIAYLLSLGLDQSLAEQRAHGPDGPRYKAIGNSWAINVVRWIGQRIQQHRSAPAAL